jgi:hypothetical protein
MNTPAKPIRIVLADHHALVRAGIEDHRMKLMDCLNVHDVPGLVHFALRTGLLPQGS